MTVKIANSKEIDEFCWQHKNNGVTGLKGLLKDADGNQLNHAFEDMVTGERIYVKYEY